MKMSNPKLLLPFFFIALAVMACAQDCMGVTFAVAGYVVDTEGNPIENATIRVWTNGSFEKPAFEISVSSNTEGYFQTDSIFIYGCTTFKIEIVADSYEAQTFTYYPPSGEGFPDELPARITIELEHIQP